MARRVICPVEQLWNARGLNLGFGRLDGSCDLFNEYFHRRIEESVTKTARNSAYGSVAALLLTIVGALIGESFFEWSFSVEMFGLGAAVSWINVMGLGSAWVLFFDKKRVALAFSIIITKYAFLVLILSLMLARSGTQEFTALAAGFASYLVVWAFVLALTLKLNEKNA